MVPKWTYSLICTNFPNCNFFFFACRIIQIWKAKVYNTIRCKASPHYYSFFYIAISFYYIPYLMLFICKHVKLSLLAFIFITSYLYIYHNWSRIQDLGLRVVLIVLTLDWHTELIMVLELFPFSVWHHST